MIGFPKIELDGFEGIWSRGNPDEVPLSHLVDGLNLRFNTLKGLYTRPGTSIKSLGTTPQIPIVDWFLAKRTGTTELIICDNAGNYYETRTGSLLFNVAGGNFVFGVNLFGFTYFVPYGGATNSSLYLHTDTQTRRAAGFPPPINVPMTISNIVAGDIPPGARTLYVSYLTNSGFLTPPGAYTPYTGVGDTKFDLSDIPIGTVGTVLKRYLLSTQAGGAIPYFIPASKGGIINNNTDTTLAGLSFFDTDLQVSANYLFNLLPDISPAKVCIFFANRLFVLQAEGINRGSVVLGSLVGDFESFVEPSCYINVNRDDGHFLNTAFVLNNVLYLCKDLGVYATSDNGQEPSYWNVDLVDGSISVPPKGIAVLSTNQSPIAGCAIIADKSGLLTFNGSFQRPELTWKVGAIWQRINKVAWNTIKLTVDPDRKLIYAAIPLDDALTPSHILVGDYSYAVDEALNYVDPLKMKWCLDSFPDAPTMIGMIDLTGDSYPILRIGSNTGNVNGLIQLDDNASDDYGHDLDSYLQTAFAFLTKGRKMSYANYNSFFTALKYNATGSVTLDFTAIGYNSKITKALFSRIINGAVANDYLNPINFTSQKMSTKIECTKGRFNIDALEVYCKPMFMVTPQ